MSATVRAQVIELFERHRETPGAPCDESHFLDFLLAEPKDKNAVRNSFRGLRRFNAFLDEAQYQFGICFSAKDREANYPLDTFAARVIELQRSSRGSLRSLENQVRAGPGWRVIAMVDLILLLAYAFVRDSTVLMAIVVTLALVLNGGFLLFAWKSTRYLKRLRRRIELQSSQGA